MDAPLLVVFDTNVLTAAARSRTGASYSLVSQIPSLHYRLVISVGLYTEWLSVLTRPENIPQGRSSEDVIAFLRYLASEAHLQEIHFLWRPFLPDPRDDMVLELAFAAGSRYIITHNVKDFSGSEQLGIAALTPREFLKICRGIS